MRKGGSRMPLVSVVTPSLNHGRFIEKTIQSVLDQDYPNLQYIVVDGGSGDDTVEILRRYEHSLVWISESDRGQSDAINKGFGMAGGEILAWLNSDDRYLPGAVSRAVECFESDLQADLVYGKTVLCDDRDRVIGEYPTEPFDGGRLPAFNFISQPSAFFMADLFREAGGLNRDLNYAMDYDLWLRMIGGGARGVYLPEPMALFRLHAESKSVSAVHALARSEECLRTVIKNCGWAPANRVYACFHHRLLLRLPAPLRELRALIIPLSAAFSFIEYLRLNRGIRRRDAELITTKNLGKLLKGWEPGDLLGGR